MTRCRLQGVLSSTLVSEQRPVISSNRLFVSAGAGSGCPDAMRHPVRLKS